MFLGLLDLEKLCDVVLVIPEYHAAKWEEKDAYFIRYAQFANWGFIMGRFKKSIVTQHNTNR